jgi:hypothetical protein
MTCRLVAVNSYEDLLVVIDKAMVEMAIGSSSAETGGKPSQIG